ncbi:uncharacterized protein FIBRA_01662 [Fibroporia radiculosa]|uniref:Protein kinase domain-containing protein n=1 Tax=Fibroporia radiculosa TaxID=599839 RepID=J4HTP5_9APHY|nr:uncharacterized protein FIBRA_01662 [Fibroporia radiculosa]CCL99642.1 predicted protein [Fibroporia radiculosa]
MASESQVDSGDRSEPPPAKDPGGLLTSEHYWRDRQEWLEQRGYMLRPRYRPDWKPSWEGNKKVWFVCEDGLYHDHPTVLDAIRISDNSVVTLKKISTTVHPHEIEIAQYLSSEPLSADPDNHCVPILEVLQDPHEENVAILVMPLLRDCNDPEFHTFGEVVAFFHQLFHGLRFIHKQRVAHCDIMALNVMMDPMLLYPRLYHPINTHRNRDLTGNAKHFTRTERPPKYYYVDFGLSHKYDVDVSDPRVHPILGGDKSVPEFQGEGYNQTWNPFKTDIYYLGNFIRQNFLKRYVGFEFMYPLIADMVQQDPDKRPTIEEVVDRFADVQARMSWWKLRSRLLQRDEPALFWGFRIFGHVFRTAKYVIKGLPPVPLPS